jgi:hypothetical protein
VIINDGDIVSLSVVPSKLYLGKFAAKDVEMIQRAEL